MVQKILLLSIALILVACKLAYGAAIPDPGLFPEGLFLEWAHRPSYRVWLAGFPKAHGETSSSDTSGYPYYGRRTYYGYPHNYYG